MVARPPTRGGVSFLSRGRRSPYVYGEDNGRRVLTAGPERELYPTKDPSDRAHTSRDQFGLLIPAAVADQDGHARPNPELQGAKAQLYPRSSMTAGGIAIDSSFDEWAEHRRRLAAEGIELGGGRLSLAQAVGAVQTRARDAIRLRDVIEQRTRVRATKDEIRLSREATRLLKQARQGGASQIAKSQNCQMAK